MTVNELLAAISRHFQRGELNDAVDVSRELERSLERHRLQRDTDRVLADDVLPALCAKCNVQLRVCDYAPPSGPFTNICLVCIAHEIDPDAIPF